MSFLPWVGKKPSPTLESGRHEDIQLYAISETLKRTKAVIDGLDLRSINQLYWLDLRCGSEELRAIYFPGDNSPTPLSNRIVELGGENWFRDLVGSMATVGSSLHLEGNLTMHADSKTGQVYCTNNSMLVPGRKRPAGTSPFIITKIWTIGDGTCVKAQSDYIAANHRFSRTNSLALEKFYIARRDWDALLEQESKNPLVSSKLKKCQAVFAAFDREVRKAHTGITLAPAENNFRAVIYGISLQVLKNNGAFAKYNMLLKTLDNDDNKPDLVNNILINVIQQVSAKANLAVVTDFKKWEKGIFNKEWDTSKVVKYIKDA